MLDAKEAAAGHTVVFLNLDGGVIHLVELTKMTRDMISVREKEVVKAHGLAKVLRWNVAHCGRVTHHAAFENCFKQTFLNSSRSLLFICIN